MFFSVKLARLKLLRYYAEVTLMTGMLAISARILDRIRLLQLVATWDKGMGYNLVDETSYST